LPLATSRPAARFRIRGSILAWTPREGAWRVAVITAVPYQSFYLSDTSAKAFIDMFYGKLERTLGRDSMGDSLMDAFSVTTSRPVVL